ncbi:hypothetical protein KP509_11G022100 [Ceratopteris richardii]|uniref:Uncharacterized protein n=1 Tax=Ceratopteris richardii TaxID=49495 RepID=A0A8T2TW59_CERRI|nr:hypothetical protein KP509_11G022100 [Ceratopteris richardii]
MACSSHCSSYKNKHNKAATFRCTAKSQWRCLPASH